MVRLPARTSAPAVAPSVAVTRRRIGPFAMLERSIGQGSVCCQLAAMAGAGRAGVACDASTAAAVIEPVQRFGSPTVVPKIGTAWSTPSSVIVAEAHVRYVRDSDGWPVLFFTPTVFAPG